MKMSEIKRPIAVIDSGLGGISVLSHLTKILPNEDFVYFGDTKNAPYGTRSGEEVCAITVKNIERLVSEYSVKAVVIACNTATGAAASSCREIFSHIPIIGIEPALKPAVTKSTKENPIVLVLATQLTLSQDKFTSLAKKYNPNAEIIPLPCPGLSDAVENEASDGDLNSLLEKLFFAVDERKDEINSVVLGCTHYPLVKDHISAFFPKAQIYDGSYGTALQTKRRLSEEGLLYSGTENGNVTLINSSNDESFEKKALKYLKR